MEQINYFKCEHCLVHTPKEDWGPGRIVCPRCNKKAPTAQEFHESNQEVWNGKAWVVDPMNHE